MGVHADIQQGSSPRMFGFKWVHGAKMGRATPSQPLRLPRCKHRGCASFMWGSYRKHMETGALRGHQSSARAPSCAKLCKTMMADSVMNPELANSCCLHTRRRGLIAHLRCWHHSVINPAAVDSRAQEPNLGFDIVSPTFPGHAGTHS